VPFFSVVLTILKFLWPPRAAPSRAVSAP